MNKYEELYKKLTDKFNKHLYDLSDEELQEILKKQIIDREEFLNMVGRILLTHNVVEGFLKLTELEKTSLGKKFTKKIDIIFSNQGAYEVSKVTKVLQEVGINKYDTNSYVLSMGQTFAPKHITDTALNRILNKTIKGKNYSDRIWDNKNQVAKELKLEVNKFLNGETSINNIENVIKGKFNANAYNSKRLVVNETARVMEGVNDKFQKDMGVEYVMYSATLDSKTCSDCGEYDGKVYKVSEKPTVPRHVMCRCTLTPLPDKDWRPKLRRDNELKETISWTTYKEWQEKH